MKIIEKEEQVDAKLLAQDNAWDMLELLPYKRNKKPALLMVFGDYAFEFLVVVNGYAQPIIVSRNSFAIIPYLEPKVVTVKYYVEEEAELKQGMVYVTRDVVNSDYPPKQ